MAAPETEGTPMTTRPPDQQKPGEHANEGEGPKPVRYIEHDGRDDAAHRTGEEREGRESEREGEGEREQKAG
jgi:hypothetical protein